MNFLGKMSCKDLKLLTIWMSLYISVGYVGNPDILSLKISPISLKDCWVCHHIGSLMKNVSILKELISRVFILLLLPLLVIYCCHFLRLLQILCYELPCSFTFHAANFSFQILRSIQPDSICPKASQFLCLSLLPLSLSQWISTLKNIFLMICEISGESAGKFL